MPGAVPRPLVPVRRRSTASRWLVAMAPVLSLAAVGVAHAEPGRSSGGADEIVVTGTRTPERAQRAVVRTDVVSRDEALRRGALHVGDALASQPGVNVVQEGSLGGASSLQMQGFDGERVLVLEDGERVVGDVGGVTDLAALPMADVERIEIVQGPSSALYGSNAIGGVINVIPRAPGPEGAHVAARAEVRSQPAGNVQAQASYRDGEEWVALDGNLVGTAPLESAEGEGTILPETTRRFVGARAGAALNERTRVRARLRFFRDETSSWSQATVPGLGRYTLEQRQRTDRIAGQIVEEVRIGRSGLFRIALAAQEHWGARALEREGSLARDERSRNYRLYSAETNLTFASRAVSWVMGARAEAEHADQRATRTTVGPSDELVTDDVPEVAPQTYGSFAGYAQGTARLPAGVTLLAGARVEHQTRYGGAGAPRVALAYEPTPALTVRTSLGRGFRAPSAKELGFAFDHSSFGYRVLGNPELAPETSWGWNADASLREARLGATLRASGFFTWVTNLIDLDLEAATTRGAVTDYAYRNVGAARTGGFTLDGAWQATTWLRVELAYSYLWARNDSADAPLAGRPPHVVTASLRMDLPGRVSIYARERLATDAYLTPDRRTPASFTLDVRVAWRPLDGFAVHAGVLNLFDQRREPDQAGDLRSPVGRVAYAGITGDFPWEQTP